MKIDYKKLVSAESNLNDWLEALPIEEETEVEVRFLTSVWKNGWNAGWVCKNMDAADFQVIEWESSACWTLDWYFDSEYEIDEEESVQLTIQISWEDDGVEHSEEWSVWDEDLAED